MFSYSTNWMGPVSLDWYKERGLTEMVTHTLQSKMLQNTLRERGFDIEIGDTYELEEVSTYFATGRIDIRDSTKPGYDGWHELSLPLMHGEDWNDFSRWLEDFITEELWELEGIVAQYEQETGKVIRWWKD